MNHLLRCESIEFYMLMNEYVNDIIMNKNAKELIMNKYVND